jgi:GPH family glycoside/pentoside/hexuronide:cation symporter
MFISGIGFGGTVFLPSAIKADVIDYDTLLAGRRREGRYIGIWALIKKITAASAVGITLSFLGMSGYTPNVEQTPKVLLILRILYVLVPSVCNFLSMVIIFVYPISRNAHKKILDAIAERQAGHSVVDPLNPKHIIS